MNLNPFLEGEKGIVRYYPDWIEPMFASLYFERIKSETDWQQQSISLFGKKVMQPRLVAWQSDNGVSYTYSGLTMQANPFSDTMRAIQSALELFLGYSFNSCLLNYYRDGNDSMGWHSDNEKSLGKNPLIASVSLGTERLFQIKDLESGSISGITLEHGSLLVMEGAFQHHYKHQLPKRKTLVGERINLTFRKIVG